MLSKCPMMSKGSTISRNLAVPLPSSCELTKLVAWALTLPLLTSLMCLFCLEDNQPMVDQPVLACVIAGVLGGTVLYVRLASRLAELSQKRALLKHSVRAIIVLGVFLLFCVAVRYLAVSDSESFAAKLLSMRQFGVVIWYGSLYGVIVATMIPIALLVGLLWTWVGCLFFKSVNGSQTTVSRSSWADCVADVVAFLAGVLIWPAWRYVLPSLGVGIIPACGNWLAPLIPIVLVVLFAVGVWLRGMHLGSGQLRRELAMAALGACSARIFSVTAVQLLQPSFEFSVAALLVQIALVLAFCVLSIVQESMSEEIVAKGESVPPLSQELKTLLGSYGLTDKEGLTYVLKEKGVSSSQIGGQLGIKAPTVREYQRRARIKLSDDGMRQVRELVRQAERTNKAENQNHEIRFASAMRVSLEVTLLLFACVPLKENHLHAGFSDAIAVSLTTGLVLAWLSLRIMWLLGLTRVPSRLKWVIRVGGTASLIVFVLWRAYTAGIILFGSIPDEMAFISVVFLTAETAILAVDVFANTGLLSSHESLVMSVCFAFGFLFEESWQASGESGFVFESLVLCVGILGGLLWLLKRMGLQTTGFALMSFLLLVISSFTSIGLLNIAVYLCVIATLALIIYLAYRGGSPFRSQSVMCGLWATPRRFDVLLVLALGSVVGMLFTRLNKLLLELDMPLGVEVLNSTFLSYIVLGCAVILAICVVIGLMDVDAVLRTDELRLGMDGNSQQSLEAGLIQQGLTPRQVRVALFLAQGWTLEEIADKLSYSRSTISRDCGALYKMLGVRTRYGLVSRLERIVHSIDELKN